MKIYQVHERGGEWEDSFDNIIKSFMSKEKAEECKKECEMEHETDLRNSKTCDKCPLCSWNVEVHSFDMLAKHCSRVTPEDIVLEDKSISSCNKYICLYDDNVEYTIKEVEVDEG